VGIGCNTGEFAGGNIGGEDRMEYTIIGDNVNLAQRIESLASRWQVFAAQQTYEPASPCCIAIELPPALVKGKSMPIKVYSVRGIQNGKGDMLLTIPVSVQPLPNGTQLAGLLTCFCRERKEILLCLPSDAPVSKGARCSCSFDLPELKKAMGLTAEVTRVEEPFPDMPHCKTVVLGNIDGVEALAFFAPGSLVESGKTWGEMERH
jgi:hypothetical protein